MKNVLLPNHWFYNAGVIGLLSVLEKGGLNIYDAIDDYGAVHLDIFSSKDEIFDSWDELTKSALNISYKGKSGGTQKYYYSNQTEKSIKEKIQLFIKGVTKSRKPSAFTCGICGRVELTTKSKAAFFNQAYSNILLASEQTFPNLYWGLSSNDFVCSNCDFVLFCHHLGLIPTQQGGLRSQLFINAPSFKTMFLLNKLAKELIGSEKNQDIKDKRQLLAMTVIEYTNRINSTLALWSTMNIEIVNKLQIWNKEKRTVEDKIEFLSIPFDVVKLISDRKIASLLSDIGEFRVLNMVLNREYPKLIDFGYRLMKESLSEKPNEKLINDSLFIWKNKQYGNVGNTANKILKLYGLIEEKLNKEKLL